MKNLNLDINLGESVFIIGVNGVGKILIFCVFVGLWCVVFGSVVCLFYGLVTTADGDVVIFYVF